MKNLDKEKFEVVNITDNDFVYTPLLAKNSIFGTFNLSMTNLGYSKQNHMKSVQDFDFDNHDFDYVVFAHGAVPNTFNIPGVEKHCHILKSYQDSKRIHSAIQELMQKATKKTKVVIIGCGPTGSELVGNLMDLNTYIKKPIEIVAIDGLSRPLFAYNEQVGHYVLNLWNSFNVVTSFGQNVKLIDEKKILLSNGTEIEHENGDEVSSVLIWCGGVKMHPLSSIINKKLGLNSFRGIPVDKQLRVQNTKNVFAIGDCADSGNIPTAQVACQQAKYLSDQFNANFNTAEEFVYNHKGQFCYVGDGNSVYQNGSYMIKGGKFAGYANVLIHFYNSINAKQSLNLAKSYVTDTLNH
eukprot:gene16768-22945_t